MYKLIIVDDEYFTRKQFENILDWNSLGFSVVASFDDGKYALEYLKTHWVDVILTDVKMTFVSGIELIKETFSMYPDIITILISAHKDFDYAHKAIQFKAFDYILKPVTYAALYDTFKRVADTLNKTNKKVFLNDYLSLKRQEFLSFYLMNAAYSRETVEEELKSLDIEVDIDKSETALLTIQFQNFTKYLSKVWKYEKDELYVALNNVIQSENYFEYIIPIPYLFDSMKIFIISKTDRTDFSQYVSEYCHKITNELGELLTLSASVNNIQYYKSFLCVKENISDDKQLDIHVRAVFDYLIDGNIVKAQKYAEAVYIFNKGNIQYIKVFAENLLSFIFTALELPGKLDFLQNFYNDCKFYDYDTLTMEISKMIQHIYSQIMQRNDEIHASIIQKATNYISDNCGNNISQADVANHAAMAVSHFSRIFQKVTGEKFIDYLIRMRMEKAKELLTSTNYKIHQICNMVGYKKQDYFYKVFKMHAGCTPLEYRKATKKK